MKHYPVTIKSSYSTSTGDMYQQKHRISKRSSVVKRSPASLQRQVPLTLVHLLHSAAVLHVRMAQMEICKGSSVDDFMLKLVSCSATGSRVPGS